MDPNSVLPAAVMAITASSISTQAKLDRLPEVLATTKDFAVTSGVGGAVRLLMAGVDAPMFRLSGFNSLNPYLVL